MTDYTFEDGQGKKMPLILGRQLAEGAAGRIFPVLNMSGVVVKLYKDGVNTLLYDRKVRAMVADPPKLPDFLHQGKTFVQIAWPCGVVLDRRGKFAGFLMPEIDTKNSTELENILQRAQRQRKRLPEFYGDRVLLAANLAVLMAELHAHQHFMIDMKPANIRFYPGTGFLAILDTDGFSINGSERFRAQHFTEEYIAPEAKGEQPNALGLKQDLFALAVIIFRLLNNGVHPFQGSDTVDGHPSPIQQRIFERLYAYSLYAAIPVNPAFSSIHTFLELETRRLFECAFTSVDHRPTAAQWKAHLETLTQKLIRCKDVPHEHGHFSRGCGLCALERKLMAPQPATPKWPSRGSHVGNSGGVAGPAPVSAGRPTPTTAPKPSPAPRAPPRQAPPVAQPGPEILKPALIVLCSLGILAALFWNSAELPPPPGPSLTSSMQYAFADIAGSLPALHNPSLYDQHLWNEHRTWAEGRQLLECRYGEGGAFSVRFWQQPDTAAYGIAWQRIIKGHPFAGIVRGAAACPPDHATALFLPRGLALEIETWQASTSVFRNGERIEVKRPPALNCLYHRGPSIDWIQYANRSAHPRCPRSYDGPPITGVAVVGG